VKLKFYFLKKTFIVYYLLRKVTIKLLIKVKFKQKNHDLLVGKEGATAKYCYSVWLRHLYLSRSNCISRHPKIVAEIGPGSSIGVGLAALISGSSQYLALEKVHFISNNKILELFDDIVNLFEKNQPIFGPDVFPNLKPFLDSYEFPFSCLELDHLEKALNPVRIENIRKKIEVFSVTGENNNVISYIVPWDERPNLKVNNVDMILSQAVLEHVDELEGVYKCMNKWLNTDGIISHQVDFRHHKTSFTWNGHWLYTQKEFDLLRGDESFLVNRLPWSAHKSKIKTNGFNLCFTKKVISKSIIKIDDCSIDLEPSDLSTSGVYFLAKK
jgi:hypothetical protein